MIPSQCPLGRVATTSVVRGCPLGAAPHPTPFPRRAARHRLRARRPLAAFGRRGVNLGRDGGWAALGGFGMPTQRVPGRDG
jgi:hypothetical protein